MEDLVQVGSSEEKRKGNYIIIFNVTNAKCTKSNWIGIMVQEKSQRVSLKL